MSNQFNNTLMILTQLLLWAAWEERRPGIDCLLMRDHSQKYLGIRLRLEIVGKINTYTSGIFPYH